MRGLGELEAAVMHVVWDRAEPITVREVLVELLSDRQLAYTTVMTVMDNLHRKGMLRRTMHGRAWLYEAAASRAEYTARIMRDVLRSADDQTAAMMHFVASMTRHESETLRDLLRHKAGRRR